MRRVLKGVFEANYLFVILALFGPEIFALEFPSTLLTNRLLISL